MNIPSRLGHDAVCLGVLGAAAAPAPLTDDAIRLALEQPVWRKGLSGSVFDRVRPGESICLVVSDQTRKTAADRVLPVLLEGFVSRGCRLSDACLLFATGIHRPPTVEEMRGILGPRVFEAFAGRMHTHDADDAANLVDVGQTPRGWRVRINRRAVEADRLVLVGAASYHYHAGFGGGRKSIVPGLASRDTIAFNHSLTLDPVQDRIHPRVEPGRLDGNPVAEEMLAGARLCDPDFIVNTVLSPSGMPAGVFAGDLDLAHRAACRLVETLCRVDIAQPADLVIADAEGAANWIQSHKALFHADRAGHGETRIILLAPCREGLGNERFRYWLRRRDPAVLYRELRAAPEVNGQTALSTLVRGRRTVLVSELAQPDIDDLGMEHGRDLEEAVDKALEALRRRGIARPTFYLMPQARHTLPFIARSKSRGG